MFVETNGARIATQAFGDTSHPTLLLIMGAMSSMLWWQDEFCDRLAGLGLHAIRYDNRDTGLSTKYEPGKPGYTFDDMADDATGVLDAYGVKAAHVVGMSMGGMIAQIVALKHPGRVLTLSLISTTPIGTDTSALPQTPADYAAFAQTGNDVDWADREQAVEHMAKDVAMIASTRHPHDMAAARAFIERDFDRSGGFSTATNHFLLFGGSDDWTDGLAKMPQRPLVIHGTSDPIFPIEHGRMIADGVAGSSLTIIEGGGHEIHRDDWDQIIGAIVARSRAG